MRRTTRRTCRAAAIALLVTAVAVVAGYPVYVRPQLDPVGRADAVVVLGGSDRDGRVQYGLKLVQQGVAGQLVLSDPYGSRQTRTARVCRSVVPDVTITCFDPDPATTQGEAEQIRALAEARGWQHVVVVTARYHVSRSRFIIERCYDGRVSMTSPEGSPGLLRYAYQYAYQTLAYGKAVIVHGCRACGDGNLRGSPRNWS